MGKQEEMGIRLIAGLGNPGKEYQETRHNVGFWFVDELAQDHGAEFKCEAKFYAEVCRINLAGKSVWLLKPTTFMNRSGQAVSAMAAYYKIATEEILIVHDELDHDAGSVRLKVSGGHAGHNGLRDIINSLGSPQFLRLRLGIGHPGSKKKVVDYVLGRPSLDDSQQIRQAMLSAFKVISELVQGKIQQAMNVLNS